MNKRAHRYDNCWRVPVLVYENGRNRTRHPIIKADTVEEAELKVRAIYDGEFVSFAGLPYHTHDVNRVGE